MGATNSPMTGSTPALEAGKTGLNLDAAFSTLIRPLRYFRRHLFRIGRQTPVASSLRDLGQQMAFVALFRLRQFVIRDRRNVKRNSHSADVKTSPGQDWPAPSPEPRHRKCRGFSRFFVAATWQVSRKTNSQEPARTFCLFDVAAGILARAGTLEHWTGLSGSIRASIAKLPALLTSAVSSDQSGAWDRNSMMAVSFWEVSFSAQLRSLPIRT
jgi:hypothetical protein